MIYLPLMKVRQTQANAFRAFALPQRLEGPHNENLLGFVKSVWFKVLTTQRFRLKSRHFTVEHFIQFICRVELPWF